MDTAPPRKASPHEGKWIVLQVAIGLALIAALGWFVHNAAQNMAQRHIAGGFGFLFEPAGFDVSEGLVPYQPTDSYLRAFAAGLANTVRAAIPALLLASLLGLAVGVASIAKHPFLRALTRVYVDVIRNVPLLVQLLLWYFVLTYLLPDAENPLHLGAFGFLSKNGLSLAAPVYEAAQGWQWSTPKVGSFGVEGGMALTPEFLALVLAMGIYAAAYCAEIVRAGLQSVPRGQWNAASALGLRWGQGLRLIILPQAMRVIIPPYTNLALNTIKNSSLAIAIGYPDLVSVTATSMNQTGQAIECVTIIAVVYLSLNLVASFALNQFNQRVSFASR